MSRGAGVRPWFTPGLIGLHVLGVAAVVVCLIGGFWQLGVYETRQGNAAEAARTGDLASLTDVWSEGEPLTTNLVNRLVTVSGSFGSADQQFWVEGEVSDDDAWLITPFLVDDSDAVLLVVRGSTDTPTDLPPVPTGRAELTVSLQPSRSGSPPIDDRSTTTGVSIPTLLNELPFRLWSGFGIVTAGTDVPAGLDRVPAPDPEVSWTVGLKNLAYSLQWWVFGAFALFMWWRMAAEQVEERVGSLTT